jgi:HTH-type transcriptional regulator/antitoxin HipB
MAARDPELMRLKLRQLLIAARDAKGLTQAELGARLGRTQSFVSAFETGRRIEVVELIQIAEALGLDVRGVIEQLG